MVGIDFVILSYAKSEKLRNLTQNCIESLYNSENKDSFSFNIFVLESYKGAKPYSFQNTQTLFPEETFGYNKYLNIGYRVTSGDYICFCNNDLIFHKGWATEIFKIVDSHQEIGCFCPIDPWLHKQYVDLQLDQSFIFGYEKMKHFTGWFFLVKRSVLVTTGLFDEKFKFWYCDDDFIQTLKTFEIPNVLVPRSKVSHLGSKTLSTIEDRSKHNALTYKQWIYYDYKWNHNSKIIYWLKYFKFILLSALNRL